MRKQETVTFQKISIKRKPKAARRDDWKRDRQEQRKTKHMTQEKWYA